MFNLFIAVKLQNKKKKNGGKRVVWFCNGRSNVCVVFSIVKEKKKKKNKFEKQTKKKVVVNTQIKIFPQNKTVFIFFYFVQNKNKRQHSKQFRYI